MGIMLMDMMLMDIMLMNMMHMMHYTMICHLACQYQYLTRVSINICVTKVHEAEENFQ